MSSTILSLTVLAVLAVSWSAVPCDASQNIHQVLSIPSSVALPVPAGKAYQRAVRVNEKLILTPLRGVNLLSSSTTVSGSVKTQAKKAMSNIQAILDVAGLDLSDISKLTVHLVDLDDLTDVNSAIYTALQNANAWPPAFTGGVEVHSSLINGAQVEIAVEAAYN